MKRKMTITGTLILALFTVAFNKPNSKTHKASPVLPPTYNVTLNGIKENEAEAMICHFNMIKSNDKRPLPTVIFFDISTIRTIVKLLDSERNAQIAAKKPGDDPKIGLTDGIRLYFACDKMANTQHNLDTRILLVSTKDNGPSTDPTCWSTRLHKDYYDHTVDPNSLKDGEVSHAGAKTPGETLYKCFKCVFEKTQCTVPGQNNITGLRARAMVTAFRFRKHPINSASVWFDLDKFRNFATTNPNRTTGIRVYFATHLFADKKIPSRDAMVMTPTEKNKKNPKYNDDYFDCKAEDSYWNDYFKLYHKYLYSSNAVDNAELCPDNCN